MKNRRYMKLAIAIAAVHGAAHFAGADDCDNNGVPDENERIIYVDADAQGNNSGTHFLHAYTDA